MPAVVLRAFHAPQPSPRTVSVPPPASPPANSNACCVCEGKQDEELVFGRAELSGRHTLNRRPASWRRPVAWRRFLTILNLKTVPLKIEPCFFLFFLFFLYFFLLYFC
jgi:hypothetical protein